MTQTCLQMRRMLQQPSPLKPSKEEYSLFAVVQASGRSDSGRAAIPRCAEANWSTRGRIRATRCRFVFLPFVPQVHGPPGIPLPRSLFLEQRSILRPKPAHISQEQVAFSAGNFHGQPLRWSWIPRLPCRLGDISDADGKAQRQASQQELPRFWREGGLESGLMIAQYTAALLSRKTRSSFTPPARFHSDVCNQEDHVSMEPSRHGNGRDHCQVGVSLPSNCSALRGIELRNEDPCRCCSRAAALRKSVHPLPAIAPCPTTSNVRPG